MSIEMSGHPGVDRESVVQFVSHLLNEIGAIPNDNIHSAATIDNELTMQSVAFIEMQVAIEDAYGIEIDPLEIIELNVFDDIINYIYIQIHQES